MSKTFLYIRGNPATGKITVARMLEKELGWKLFWFHDLKNAVFNIVQEHRIPRLMDDITKPVIRHLLEKGENIIYVRPSPDTKTIEEVRRIVEEKPDYKFVVVQLTASYETLLERVKEREDFYRISNKEDLDSYLQSREVSEFPGEHLVPTDGNTPEDVHKNILQIL